MDKKQVVIQSLSLPQLLEKTDASINSLEVSTKRLHYDYLVIALGSVTKFFGMSDVQKYAFTIKSLNDAINLRNHIIYLLVIGATEDSVKLNDGVVIPTMTIIWSGGVAPNPLISNFPSCEYDIKSGRIVVDRYLELPNYKGVYALGDCAFITDPNTGDPYPPTAQHAIREGAVVAKNIIAEIEGNSDERKVFDYKTKGMMATIGKRTDIGNVLGIQVQGCLAWWIWRNYYLINLPTIQKKVRVLADWAIDVFFKRDVTMFKNTCRRKKY